MEPVRQLRLAVFILTAVLLVGSSGSPLSEGRSPFNAFNMTVIPLATLGFKEIQELSQEGKVFTILLIIGRIAVIAYALGSLIQFMVESPFRQVVGWRKRQLTISLLKDHYLICGFGRLGWGPTHAS